MKTAARPAPVAAPVLSPALANVIRTIGPPVSAAALLICILTYWVLSGGFGTIAQVRISVTDASVPVPATPGITAAYFTIHNSGDQPDELVAVRTSAAAQSMLIDNPTSGASGRMSTIQGVTVPAHSSATLGPFGDDVMITGAHPLRVGQTVTLILTFRTVGDITVTATVTPPGTP
ncbi:MAG TPA: copper chaperone PCu(A)C [Actinocrinis sp.]|nr:copper chaperone PCu(A)C [Actinocrinis sp.]